MNGAYIQSDTMCNIIGYKYRGASMGGYTNKQILIIADNLVFFYIQLDI